MKAAILHAVNEPLLVDDVEIRAPRAREVLVRTVASGVCHSDHHFADGSWTSVPLPMLLGHEGAGVVEAVGEGVTYVAPGDHVVMSARPYCGSCNRCVGGQPYLCFDPSVIVPSIDRLSWKGKSVAQMSSVGSFAEQMLTVDTGVVKIDRELPLDAAALIGCAVTTGVGAVFNTARLQAGSIAAVLGCGGVGLNIIQGCRIAGASRIVAVDVLDSKLELARQFGATDVINGSEVDAVAAAKEITGDGIEYAFEAIGSSTAARQAFDMLRMGGTAVVVGMMPQGEEIHLTASDFLFEKKVIGCHYGSARFREQIPQLLDLHRHGQLDLSGLISKRFPLEGINDAFAAMCNGEVARALVTFDA